MRTVRARAHDSPFSADLVASCSLSDLTCVASFWMTNAEWELPPPEPAVEGVGEWRFDSVAPVATGGRGSRGSKGQRLPLAARSEPRATNKRTLELLRHRLTRPLRLEQSHALLLPLLGPLAQLLHFGFERLTLLGRLGEVILEDLLWSCRMARRKEVSGNCRRRCAMGKRVGKHPQRRRLTSFLDGCCSLASWASSAFFFHVATSAVRASNSRFIAVSLASSFAERAFSAAN